MKLLTKPIPQTTYIDVLKLIIKSKHKDSAKLKLTSKLKELEKRYQHLESLIKHNSLEKIQTDDTFTAIKDELEGCYLTKPKGIKEADDRIRVQQHKLQLSKCPYCGTTLPGTLDHYLPRNSFPEYSVHMLNLIPCCSVCNSMKKERWIKQSHRLFLYLYSDCIPEDQYLHINLTHKNETKAISGKFYIKRPNSDINDTIWELIESHYKELNLLDRYHELLNDEIYVILLSCVAHIKDGGKSIKGFLNNQIVYQTQVFGANHWRIVLWNALSENDFFLDLVSDETNSPS